MMVRRYGSQSAASLAAEADRDQSTADRYAKMLALATELGLEYEVERMGAAVAEYEDSAEALRERALLAGYNPDDYATVGPNEAARLASRSGGAGVMAMVTEVPEYEYLDSTPTEGDVFTFLSCLAAEIDYLVAGEHDAIPESFGVGIDVWGAGCVRHLVALPVASRSGE